MDRRFLIEPEERRGEFFGKSMAFIPLIKTEGT